MSNDDPLDQQLRRIAETSMERRAEAVDTDVALGDHRVRLQDPPTVAGHDRRWLAAAAAVVILAAGITAIAWPRSAASPDLVATETVATLPSTTGTVSVTTDRPTETTTTTISTTTAAAASPSTVQAGGSVEITPAGSVQRTCNDVVTLTSTGPDQPRVVGQIAGNWVPAPSDGAPVTYPACQGITSDEAVSVSVPVNVPGGTYQLCMTQPDVPAGCAMVTIEAAGTDGAGCTSEPLKPPSLVDGSSPGDGVVTEQAGGRLVRWGDSDSPFAVTQGLGFPVDVSYIDYAIENERVITAGDWQATTVAVGDPPISGITIFLRDVTDGCVRTYTVGPGLYSDEVSTLAEEWVAALSSGEPIAPSGHSDIGLDYFGRRITPFDAPFFEIDEIGPAGAMTGTLSNDQIVALFSRYRLSDGTIVRLDGTPSENRCTNRPLVRSGTPETADATTAVNEARSIAATPAGTLLATRDVCPPGTKWGDPGTFSELIEVDPAAANSSVTSLRTWQSDPDQIVLEDGTRVIAFGEHTLGDVSPDGRYASTSELYESDSRRWSLLDLNNNATTLSPPSICESAGDIVGPPRFVGDNVVVLARLCATLHAGNDTHGGDVQVEAIDLAATQPGDSIVWNSSVPGLGVNEFTRSVDLSARRDTNNTIWAIVAGNGDLEVSSQSYALGGGEIVDITRLGYQTFAFQAEDLITQFDSPPT